jgi:hypothetical protein
MKFLLIMASVASMTLAGCATTPSDSAKSVYALKASFAAALDIAVAYSALPACPQPDSLCSDTPTISRMLAASLLVQQDLDTAQAAAQSGQTPAMIAQEMLVAQTDLNALTAITSTVKTK